MRTYFKSQFIVLLILATSGCSRTHRPDELAIVTQVKQLHELATVRYSIQRVVAMREPKVPLGEESLLLMVEGVATAGVDLSALTRNRVRFTGPDTVVVDLPDPKLFDVSLDEKKTRVWDRQVTWWTPWVPFSPDLETRARLKAVDDVRGAAIRMGILEQAQHNAETSIRELLNLVDLRTTFRKMPS